jgi:hypothetical protein
MTPTTTQSPDPRPAMPQGATPGAHPPPPARAGSPIIKYFVPGMVIGFVVGAFAGAIAPTMLGADQPTLRPAGGNGHSAGQPPMTRAEREAAEAAAEHLRQSMEEAEGEPGAAEVTAEPMDETEALEHAPTDPEAEPTSEPPPPSR